jgi:hypothetical protein
MTFHPFGSKESDKKLLNYVRCGPLSPWGMSVAWMVKCLTPWYWAIWSTDWREKMPRNYYDKKGNKTGYSYKFGGTTIETRMVI